MSKNTLTPDGTYDGIGVMASLTGLVRGTALSIAAHVTANQARLNACGWHEFEPIPGSELPGNSHKRYRCRNCGGEVDAAIYYWHEQGRRARVPSEGAIVTDRYRHLLAERDRLREALAVARDYVADEIAYLRNAYRGYQDISRVVEADLARIDAALGDNNE